MANLGRKGGIYHVRFRLAGKEFKKSLKTRDRKAAGHLIKLTLHRLYTGQLNVPRPGLTPATSSSPAGRSSLPHAGCGPAALSLDSRPRQRVRRQRPGPAGPVVPGEPGHAPPPPAAALGGRADAPADQVGFRDLDGCLKARLAARHPNTAERERITLLQFYKWVAQHGYVAAAPAAGLARSRAGRTGRRSGPSPRSRPSSPAAG